MKRLLVTFGLWAALTAPSVGLGEALVTRSPLPEEVQSDLLKSLETDPLNPRLHRELAEAYTRNRKFTEAISQYQKVLELSPRDADARVHLAELFAWTGDLDRSLVAYRDLLSMEPGHREARLGMAQVLRWSQRYTEAQALYESILQNEPEHLEAIKGLARTYAMAGDFKSGLNMADQGIAIAPKDPFLYTQKGILLGWMGRYKEAKEFLLTALDLDPRFVPAYRTLGDIHVWEKKFGDAVDNYQKALEIDPDSTDTAMDLARAYQSDDRMGQAEEAVKMALRRAPEDRKALELLQEIRRGRPLRLDQWIERVLEPAGLVVTLVLLIRFFYRNRREAAHRSRFFRTLFRRILPGLFILLIAAYSIQLMISNELVHEVVEYLIFVALGFSVFLWYWHPRASSPPTLERVLVVGAHPDDIELGAGGCLLRFKDEGAKVYGLVMSMGEKGTSGTAARRREEAEAAARVLGLDDLEILDFPDSRLRDHRNDIQQAIEERIKKLDIRMVITHGPEETHSDHRTVFEAAREAARGHSLICFESISSPKEFIPNFFVDITPYLPEKIRAIGLHKSQQEKLYMDPEIVKGRAAHRGLQAGVPFAEAFWIYRWLR